MIMHIIRVLVQNKILCSLKGQICAIAASFAQDLESEECPRYHAHNFKSILGQTKNFCQPDKI